jgi:ketopantoate reductase
VVLATSASAAARAGESIPAWVPIVCVTNGLTPELAAARNGMLSYGVVEFAVSSHGPGVSGRSKRGWLTLQRASAGGATTWLAGALNPRMQRARLTDDIDAHRRGKLMLNSSLDPVAAVIGGMIGDVFRSRESLRAFRALLGEGLGVARAAGWKLRAVQGARPEILAAVFGTPLVRAAAARAAAHQARRVSSTLSREIRRGDVGEAEHLCGAIILEGARLGMETPAHCRAMDVLRQVAAEPGGNGGRPELASMLIQE